MPKKVPWEVLLEVIGRFPEGATLEEVMLSLSPKIPSRTLQRWLAILVKNNNLQITGKARARRYILAKALKEETIALSFPLTEEGRAIQKNVGRPIHLRNPITYNREFLDQYRPNHTFYLSEDTRKKLFRLGNINKGDYPAGTYARQIFQRLMIDLSWNSSRLEGNTYSLLETEKLLEWGKAPVGKDLRETQMILNHKAAIEFLIHSAETIGINRYTILNLHTLLSDNLLSDPASCGRLRTFSVGISHSTYLPLAIPQVIQECFDGLVLKASRIEDPFEQAFFLMVQIPYLQAFDDVNKRTSRLAANIPLIQQNLCPLSFIDVPEKIYINGLLGIYELNRIELLRDVFVWAYERSCALYSTTKNSLGEPDPFRMQYRIEIRQIVQQLVLDCLNKEEAVNFIRKQISHAIPKEDQPRLIEIVERELLSLHEGNIARYQLKPREYELWKKSWK